MKIRRRYLLQCAHSLPATPPSHKCHREHGHCYYFWVTVAGAVDPLKGWFIDFAEIDAAWQHVHQKYDHRNLNDLMANPTTENLVMDIFDMLAPLLPGLFSISAGENEHSEVYIERTYAEARARYEDGKMKS